MPAYAVDPSVALAWLLPDETNTAAEAVRQAIEDGAETWVPAHWWLEIANGLLMAERRGRITAEGVAQAISLIDALPLEEDEETAEQIPGRTVALARKHGLTLYDAAYLELARGGEQFSPPLTNNCLKAASKEGVPVSGKHPAA